MSQNTFRQGLWALFVFALAILSSPCWAFNAKKAACELGETIVRKFGGKGSQEFASLGGQQAIEALLKKASAEGGEQLTAKVIKYGSTYGVQGLKAISRSPARMVQALDRLPPGKLKMPSGQLNATQKLAARLVGSAGPEALRCLVKHPGLGFELLEKLGRTESNFRGSFQPNRLDHC